MVGDGRGRGGRETFYEAQRRHRRASWRFTALSAVAVILVGLPLSALVSPVLTAGVFVGLDVANEVVDTPDAVGRLEDFADRWSDAVDARERGETGPATELPVRQAVTVGVLLLLPGVVVMLGAWLVVRRVFMRAATGAVVLAAGARPPNPADVEEQQLVHLVEEVALAAGVPPPRVAVVDGDLLNAAVVGRSPEDATIVVPRGLLEELGRDPTGAVVADLLATVVNGDLRAALALASVYQTFDLVGAVVAAPLSRRTRRVLRRVARLAFRRRPGGRAADGREEQWMAEELADLAALGGLDDDAGGGASGCLTFPFLAASIAWNLTLLLVGGALITPALSALWRRRRLLADATAVELTRHPDALVAAFEHLERRAAAAPPGPWAHLFLVGPEVRAGLARRRFDQRMAELRAERPRPGESAWAAARRKVRESSRAQADYQRALDEATAGGAGAGAGDNGDGDGDGGGSPAGADGPLRIGTEHFLPRMDERLARLEAMGGRLADRPAAPVTPERPRPVGLAGWVGRGLWWVAVVLFAAVVLTVIAGLLLALLALLAGLVYMALLFQVLLLALPVVLVNELLR